MKLNGFYLAKEKGLSFSIGNISANLSWKWFDLWFGFYYDKGRKYLYFCPIPTVVFRFKRKPKNVVTTVTVHHKMMLPIKNPMLDLDSETANKIITEIVKNQRERHERFFFDEFFGGKRK